jgi:homocitrate synthase NifV
VGGLGERAGNAAIEQVAMALEVLGFGKTSLDLARLPHLCLLVAEMTKRPVPPDAPIVGSQVFRHSSGIHVSGMLKETTAFEGFAPSLCGRERELTVDAHSGKAAVQSKLTALGYGPQDATVLRRVTSVFQQRGSDGLPIDQCALIESLARELSTASNR